MQKTGSHKTGPDDLRYYLVFFSTFEELKLPIHRPMEDAGVIKLYEPSPTPCLYVAKAENMVGRIPLIPCWMAMRLQLSLTSTARTRVHVSLPDVLTQLQRIEGKAATSMRLTLGCGSLDVANLALAA